MLHNTGVVTLAGWGFFKLLAHPALSGVGQWIHFQFRFIYMLLALIVLLCGAYVSLAVAVWAKATHWTRYG